MQERSERIDGLKSEKRSRSSLVLRGVTHSRLGSEGERDALPMSTSSSGMQFPCSLLSLEGMALPRSEKKATMLICE